MATQYVTHYACKDGSLTEHIWRRRLTKGLYRSLCGLLSDGSGLGMNDYSVPCGLCERIQKSIDFEAAYASSADKAQVKP